MGRYAFFNTGFERKFAFGIQESSDIMRFGGVIATTEEDVQRGDYRHAWSADRDAHTILQILQSYVMDTDVILPDFFAFSTDLNGTYDLRRWFDTCCDACIDILGVVNFYTLELGCLIYHQLLYKPDLQASYE